MEEIKRPFKISDIDSLVQKHYSHMTTQYVLDYWDKKKWKTLKGIIVKTIDAAVSVANSDFLTKQRKAKGLPTKNIKKIRKMNECKEKLKKSKFTSYNNQLVDARWKAFRIFVLTARGCACERCGETKTLQIHHLKYIDGRAAWEYTCNEVIVLCKKCHEKEHNITNKDK